MNMIRNILTLALAALGIGLWFIPTDQWTWLNYLGGQAVMAVDFMGKAEPYSTILCLAIATALFMTRKQY
ncbi:MAG: hypothetical protein LV481_05545 [Methylacidiphilales bacterium]|nr:hypothetical protein [Candidatus Methylacidiphilales bacterium]